MSHFIFQAAYHGLEEVALSLLKEQKKDPDARNEVNHYAYYNVYVLRVTMLLFLIIKSVCYVIHARGSMGRPRLCGLRAARG